MKSKIIREVRETEEFKCYSECMNIIKKYNDAKLEFERKYKSDDFECYYDVFLNVKNKELLEAFKEAREDEKSENNIEISCEDCAYTTFSSKDYNNRDIRILQNMYAFLVEKFYPLQNNNSPESIRAMEILQDLKALIEKATSTNT